MRRRRFKPIDLVHIRGAADKPRFIGAVIRRNHSKFGDTYQIAWSDGTDTAMRREHLEAYPHKIVES